MAMGTKDSVQETTDQGMMDAQLYLLELVVGDAPVAEEEEEVWTVWASWEGHRMELEGRGSGGRVVFTEGKSCLFCKSGGCLELEVGAALKEEAHRKDSGRAVARLDAGEDATVYWAADIPTGPGVMSVYVRFSRIGPRIVSPFPNRIYGDNKGNMEQITDQGRSKKILETSGDQHKGHEVDKDGQNLPDWPEGVTSFNITELVAGLDWTLRGSEMRSISLNPIVLEELDQNLLGDTARTSSKCANHEEDQKIPLDLEVGPQTIPEVLEERNTGGTCDPTATRRLFRARRTYTSPSNAVHPYTIRPRRYGAPVRDCPEMLQRKCNDTGISFLRFIEQTCGRITPNESLMTTSEETAYPDISQEEHTPPEVSLTSPRTQKTGDSESPSQNRENGHGGVASSTSWYEEMLLATKPPSDLPSDVAGMISPTGPQTSKRALPRQLDNIEDSPKVGPEHNETTCAQGKPVEDNQKSTGAMKKRRPVRQVRENATLVTKSGDKESGRGEDASSKMGAKKASPKKLTKSPKSAVKDQEKGLGSPLKEHTLGDTRSNDERSIPSEESLPPGGDPTAGDCPQVARKKRRPKRNRNQNNPN
ncbi:hypothetical protein AAG570_004458 [Ranatra chinensis]|uniref:Uncharacterized protein n=1 Tax=Ranatra chinensis TaxID=642074 RepID=A0ABD0Y385_9HEMI